jgi:nitrogen-specific signal transduction histidine kinase/CheY-like chemotaxis protein
VTERKHLEEQFRQAQKMEAVGRLAGGVAHDFNNMLTLILGYSDLMLQTLAPASPQFTALGEIKRAAERAAALTRQLLAFSRKQVIAPRVLDVNALVANMDKMLRPLIGEDVELVTALGPGAGPVRADVGQLEQVLVNLAVNARDAMPQGGRLTIATANVELDEACARTHLDVRPGPYLCLTVQDTGCGMDEEVLAHLFEPFFTTKEVGKGTGLGLSTAYAIVRQTGGHIDVTSAPGQGTTFRIYLPRATGPVEPDPAAGSPGEASGAAQTILVVEDEETVRALVGTVLRQHGYTVLEAADAGAALQLGAEHPGPVHLLVTDVVMPRVSGHQLAQRLQALRPGLKVLYLSGHTEDAILRAGVREAEISFLPKPFTPEDLARKVRDVLAS